MNNDQPLTPPSKDIAEPTSIRPQRRRWYRLHWSTWMLIAAVLAVLTLMNGPGRFNNHGAFVSVPLYYEHGWPLVFLDRFDPPNSWPVAGEASSLKFLKEARDKQLLPWAEMTSSLGTLEDGFGSDTPIWLDRGSWTFTGKWHICWIGLTLDIAMSLVLAISLAAGYEFWSRKHWHYSLRSLLLGVFALAVVMAWWRTAVNNVEREFQTAEVLREKRLVISLECDAPVFLKMLIGTNHLRPFKHVREVLFDSVLPSPPLITDADIKNIDDFPYLKLLSLSETPVTDKSMEYIRGLANLEVLYLDNTQITDAGLKSIHNLPHLRFMNLANTKVTGEGFQYLINVPRLEDLILNDCPITDDSLSRLTMLAQIRRLSLSRTNITETGLWHLKNMQIKVLSLTGTKVSDRDLKCLEEFSELENVDLIGTKVTAEGVERLRRALPNCQIDWPELELDNPFER
jgi:hypothetical protein